MSTDEQTLTAKPKPTKKLKPARKQVKAGDVEKTETVQTGKEYSQSFEWLARRLVPNKVQQTSGTTNGLVEIVRTTTQSECCHLLCHVGTHDVPAKSSHKRGVTSRKTLVSLVPTRLASDIAVSSLHAVVVPMDGNATISTSFQTQTMPYPTAQKTALPETSLLITETTWVVWVASTVKIAHYTSVELRRPGLDPRLRRSSTVTSRNGERLSEVRRSFGEYGRGANFY